jgi:hypothetical protein
MNLEENNLRDYLERFAQRTRSLMVDLSEAKFVPVPFSSMLSADNFSSVSSSMLKNEEEFTTLARLLKKKIHRDSKQVVAQYKYAYYSWSYCNHAISTTPYFYNLSIECHIMKDHHQHSQDVSSNIISIAGNLASTNFVGSGFFSLKGLSSQLHSAFYSSVFTSSKSLSMMSPRDALENFLRSDPFLTIEESRQAIVLDKIEKNVVTCCID